MANDQKTNVDSVEEGLGKLLREVRGLQSAVTQLTKHLGGFVKGQAGYIYTPPLPPEAGGGGSARARTDEPISAIQQLRYEVLDKPNLKITTKAILVISKEIDNALRDIRAVRVDVEAIRNDTDLHDAFKKWQEQQR